MAPIILFFFLNDAMLSSRNKTANLINGKIIYLYAVLEMCRFYLDKVGDGTYYCCFLK